MAARQASMSSEAATSSLLRISVMSRLFASGGGRSICGRLKPRRQEISGGNRMAARSLIAAGSVLCLLICSPSVTAQTIRVGHVNTVSDAGLYVAERKGYFKEVGLAIELTSFTTAANMIAPLGAAQLDVGGGTVAAGLYNAAARDIGIKIVADKG